MVIRSLENGIAVFLFLLFGFPHWPLLAWLLHILFLPYLLVNWSWSNSECAWVVRFEFLLFSERPLFFSYINHKLCYNIYLNRTSHLHDWLNFVPLPWGILSVTLQSEFSPNSASVLVCEHRWDFCLFLCRCVFSCFWQDRIRCNVLIIDLAWHPKPFLSMYVLGFVFVLFCFFQVH